MSEKKNLVVIGYGGMGGGFHCTHAQKSDVVSLAGIYDIDPEKRAKAEANGIKAYPTLEAVLEDRSVDLVTVAVPNDCHKDIVIRALEAGKNVICEKPVALNSEELEEMIAASDRTGKLFTVHQNRRWDTDMLRIKALYNKGELGQVVSIESRIHGSRGIPGDWRKQKAHGGGMVLDWGVHLIDQALQIVPEKITSVYARLDYITTKEVDDGCHIVIGFENGVYYTVEVGTCNFISLPRFYMRGSVGTAIIRNWDMPMEVTVRKTAGTEKDATPIKAESGLTKTMAPRDADTTYSYEVPMPPSDVHDFYRNFCRAIDGKEKQLITHDQMRRVMKVMELSFESDRLGQVIKTEL